MTTIANKLKISSRKVYSKLTVRKGDLQWRDSKEDKKLLIVRLFSPKNHTKRFDVTKITDPEKIKDLGNLWKTRTDLADRLRAEICDSCGRDVSALQVHHVRKLKNMKSKDMLHWLHTARNRKTIVMCSKCHNLLHQGKLSSDINTDIPNPESRMQ